MLRAFRSFAKSWVAAILIGLLVVSFAIFGINDVFGARLTNGVIKAGDKEVSELEFRAQFDNWKKGVQQQSGRPVSTEEAVQARVHLRLLEQLADQKSLSAMLDRMGVRASTDLVTEQISQIPAFFDNITGRFSEDNYRQALARENLTPALFEADIREGISGQHFQDALIAGLQPPRAYAALQAALIGESRDLAYVTITPADVGAVAPPTDAQLQAFVRENAAQLRRPEFRRFTVAIFSASAVRDVSVAEADIVRAYEFQKDSLSRPERRTFVQIPARDAATGQRIAAALRAGQDPAAVARANNVEVVRYDDRPKSSVVDKKIADAAFSLTAGQVSQPVQGDLGLAVLKVISVTPGQTVSLEQARPQIVERLTQEARRDKVYELVERFTQLREQGRTIEQAAREVGVPLQSLPPITQEGQAPNGQRLPLPEQLMTTGFALGAREESDVEDAGNNEYFAVRVDAITPAGLPPLAELRGPMTQTWIARERLRRMQERADQLAARVRRGETLQAVAASAGKRVETAGALTRLGGPQAQALGADVVGRAFGTAKNGVFSARGANGFVVGQVTAITPAAPAEMARAAENRRAQMQMELGQDLFGMAVRGSREALKTQVYPDRAASALGVAPQEEAPADKAKK